MEVYCQKLAKTNRFFCKLFFRRPIEKGDRLSAFSGHYFSFQDIRDELKEAGFSVVYEAGRPYGHVVAHKIMDVALS
jgi:hypothetical protein